MMKFGNILFINIRRIHRQCREALLIVGFICLTIMIAVGAVALGAILG